MPKYPAHNQLRELGDTLSYGLYELTSGQYAGILAEFDQLQSRLVDAMKLVDELEHYSFDAYKNILDKITQFKQGGK